MDSNKLYFIGGLTTAAVAGIYVFWGPNQQSKRNKKAWVNGLENLGNTCFLNAVLQALAPCSSVTSWVSRQKEDRPILTSALSKILKGINNDTSSKTVSHPAEVLSALQFRNWVISSHEQDAHELYHALTTTLQEELLIEQSPLSLLEVKKIIDEPKCPLFGVASRVCRSLTAGGIGCLSQQVLPTKGLIACSMVCKTCGFRNSIRYDSFDSISLTLPEHFWGSLKLDQCLRQWSAAELVPGVICPGCSKQTPGIKQRSTFIKQLCFGRLPSCLCLHLMRSVWLPMGTPCKRYEHVTFPEYLSLKDYFSLPGKQRSLDLSMFHSGLFGGTGPKQCIQRSDLETSTSSTPTTSVLCATNTNHESPVPSSNKSSVFNHVYQLKSVIVHLGDTFSGHFITYRRGPKNKQNNLWFCVSDMSVHEVSYSEVFKSSAYMLFYEKM